MEEQFIYANIIFKDDPLSIFAVDCIVVNVNQNTRPKQSATIYLSESSAKTLRDQLDFLLDKYFK